MVSLQAAFETISQKEIDVVKQLIPLCFPDNTDTDKALVEELGLICKLLQDAQRVQVCIKKYMSLGPDDAARNAADRLHQNPCLMGYFQAVRTFRETEDKVTSSRKDRAPMPGMDQDCRIALMFVTCMYGNPTPEAMRDALEQCVSDFASLFAKTKADFQAVTHGYENGSWKRELGPDASVDELMAAAKDKIANIDSQVLDSNLTYIKQAGLTKCGVSK